MMELVSEAAIGIDDDPCDHWTAIWVTPSMTRFVHKATWLPAVKSFSEATVSE